MNQVEAATTAEKKKANAGDIDLSKIKDGTYEGQANGYRGLVKVSVTVKDHKITAIKVLSNSDDAAFFNRASAGVIKNILAKQSLKVDVVSGATYSSNGIIKAVKNALTGEEDKTAAKQAVLQSQQEALEQRMSQVHIKMEHLQDLHLDIMELLKYL